MLDCGALVEYSKQSRDKHKITYTGIFVGANLCTGRIHSPLQLMDLFHSDSLPY